MTEQTDFDNFHALSHKQEVKIDPLLIGSYMTKAVTMVEVYVEESDQVRMRKKTGEEAKMTDDCKVVTLPGLHKLNLCLDIQPAFRVCQNVPSVQKSTVSCSITTATVSTSPEEVLSIFGKEEVANSILENLQGQPCFAASQDLTQCNLLMDCILFLALIFLQLSLLSCENRLTRLLSNLKI